MHDLAGARHVQVFNHGVIPSILPSLLGIALYRLDENIRSSRSLGFVGVDGIGGEPLSGMSLFSSLPPRTYRNLELYGGRVCGCICSESTAGRRLQVVRPKETPNRRRRRLAPAPTRARALRCSW